MQPNESAVGLPPSPATGQSVRTLAVTTLINGVVTTVQMDVVALADANGNVIDDFADYNFKIAMLRELREIRRLMGKQVGELVLDVELPQLAR